MTVATDCNHHCGSWPSDLTVSFMDPRVNGIGVAAAFDQWYCKNVLPPHITAIFSVVVE